MNRRYHFTDSYTILLKASSIFSLFFVLCVSLFFIACGRVEVTNNQASNPVTTGEVYKVTMPGTYDSADICAIVSAIDAEASTITLYNRVVERYYTLVFDGTTRFSDKYNTALVVEQLEVGDVVDVTFLKSKKLMNSLQKSTSAWEYEDITEYTLDSLNMNLKMVDGDYHFKEDIKVFLDGEKASLMDINSVDSLTVGGEGREVYSIKIANSHGYLRLKGQEHFVGGWIEIGTSIIRSVTEDMLIAVPVGTYDVSLTNKKIGGTKTVQIDRGQETILDVSDLVVAQDVHQGDIIFVTTPQEVDIYLDGEEVDQSKPVEVEYGIHQLIARAQGYDTITQYIKVGQEHATLDITLEKTKEDSKKDAPVPSSPPQITASVPSVVDVETSSYRVKIEAPEGAEVYLDGSYIGIVPIDFAKNPGSHVVTLRKEGYETRSYTITLDSLLQNESFSFALLKGDEDTKNNEEAKDELPDESGEEKTEQE